MAVKPSVQRTLSDSSPTQLNNFVETRSVGEIVITYSVSLPFHIGGPGVTNSGGSRGALMPAGVYSEMVNLADTATNDDDFWLIAPSGTSPVIEAYAKGL